MPRRKWCTAKSQSVSLSVEKGCTQQDTHAGKPLRINMSVLSVLRLYVSISVCLYNTYIYSVYSGLKQLTMAQIICSFTVFFQRFYAACFPLHRILCATTRALSRSLPPSLPLPLLTQVLENTIASRHTHIHCKHFRILSVCCCCAAKMFCLLLKWQ